MIPLLTLAAILGAPTSLPAQATGAPAAPPAPTGPMAVAKLLEGYRDSAAIAAEARAIAAAHPDLVKVEAYGTSAEGRELLLLSIGKASGGRPGILIAGGLDGTHALGPELALRVAKAIAAEHADLLDRVTFYVVPLANPDALEATRHGPLERSTTGRPVDDDRDGTLDEDAPRDIDGDGLVLQMRVKDPPPPWQATLMVDEKDPRLLRKPDAAKGELANYLLLTESLDSDGDGRLGEDGPGGVDLDHNFPHRWPEFTKDAGPIQLSERESKALADLVIAKPDLVAAIVFGRHDSLVSVPETRDMDTTGRTPLVYLPADLPIYQELGKAYREATGQSRTSTMDPAGSFWLWLADHRGLVAVAATGWGRPDAPKAEPAKGEEGAASKPADGQPSAAPGQGAPPSDGPPGGGRRGGRNRPQQRDGGPSGTPPASGAPAPAAAPSGPAPTPAQGAPAGAPPQGPLETGAPDSSARERARQQMMRGGGRRGGGGGDGPTQPRQEGVAADQDAADWIAYLERERGGLGLVAWHEVDHPVFGMVEVGGIDPLVKLNPPASALDELGTKQTAFVLGLVDRLPKLAWSEPHVTKLADNLWRIEMSVANVGKLPTATRMGRTARTIDPLVVRVLLPLEQILGGERVRKIEGLDPGERVNLEWLVRCEPDAPIEIHGGNPSFGPTTFVIRNGAVQPR